MCETSKHECFWESFFIIWGHIALGLGVLAIVGAVEYTVYDAGVRHGRTAVYRAAYSDGREAGYKEGNKVGWSEGYWQRESNCRKK